jgi:hypothetical protein
MYRSTSPLCTLDRRLGGPQSRSGRLGEENIFDPTGTQLRPFGLSAHGQSLFRLRYPSNWCECSQFSGFYVPPMLIYSSKRMKSSSFVWSTPRHFFRCQNKLWMDSEVFCEWKCHFIPAVKPMPQEKVLLILDSRQSVTR